MKKILFLTFDYPYGHFGPSDNCSLKIMKALVGSGKYNVHNVSYCGCKSNYEIDDGIILHLLPFPEGKRVSSRSLIHLRLMLSLPIYPMVHPLSCFRLYRATRDLIRNEQFDLVVCQCNPEASLWTGTLLKKHGYIDKLMVIFWDSIYGKLPRRVIPKGFALRRQRWAEGIVAKYADRLVSLYPLKAFHDHYGELPQAIGKRFYLGIPSVIQPQVMPPSPHQEVIVGGSINMLYSGTIFRESYVEYLINLINATPMAENINLIFFQRGVSAGTWDSLRKIFRGSIYVSSWIPLPYLLALYPHVDFFMSYPGNPTAVRSKLFEYISFGKPLLVLYDDDSDVNITTFAPYPACHCIDVRRPAKDNAISLAEYVQNTQGMEVSFEETEKIFLKDSPKAYLELIEEMLNED